MGWDHVDLGPRNRYVADCVLTVFPGSVTVDSSIELHEHPNECVGCGLDPRGPAASDLVEQVIYADVHSAAQIDLGLTWRELIRGRVSVVGSFFSPQRCGLILAPPERPRDPPLSGRRLEILESILCGVPQNSISIDLDLAPSTVALNARMALESLGVSWRPSRVHPALMLAAMAGRHGTAASSSLSFVSSPLGEVQVVGIARPDLRLVGVLPTAELEVTSMLIEGACYAEIAERRGRAQRTVANQLAAVFSRMRVSGRSELLQRLFALGGDGQLSSSESAPPQSSTPRYSRPTAPRSLVATSLCSP